MGFGLPSPKAGDRAGQNQVTHRKHISWKTRCAAALLAPRIDVPYDDAKEMTEDQLLSLVQWDHNKLHSNEDADRDAFWNLTPMLIKAHRIKSKQDAKIIAKSRRIRVQLGLAEMAEAIRAGMEQGMCNAYDRLGHDDRYQDGWNSIWGKKRKIRSRGFDRRLRRRMDGTVEPR